MMRPAPMAPACRLARNFCSHSARCLRPPPTPAPRDAANKSSDVGLAGLEVFLLEYVACDRLDGQHGRCSRIALHSALCSMITPAGTMPPHQPMPPVPAPAGSGRRTASGPRRGKTGPCRCGLPLRGPAPCRCRTGPSSRCRRATRSVTRQSNHMLQWGLTWARFCSRGSSRRYLSSQGVRTARAGRPATLVNSTMSSGFASASTALEFGAASHSSRHREGGAQLHRGGPQAPAGGARPPGRKCRRRGSGDLQAGLAEELQHFGQHTSKSKRLSFRSATLAAPR